MLDRVVTDQLNIRGGAVWRGVWLAAFGAGLLVVLLALAPTGLVAAAPAISAHARYTSSIPAANAILKSAPTLVTVHFAEQVNPSGSAIAIYDSNGKQVSTAAAQVDRADLTTMTVSMRGDGSEIYLVVWHTVSGVDGDTDIGGFNFLVNPSTASIQAVQGNTSATSGGNSTSTTGSSSGAPIWLVVVIGLLGLVIGGGGLFFAQRQGWAPALTPARTAS